MRSPESSSPPSHLLVSQADAAGLPSIPGTDKEVEALLKLLKSRSIKREALSGRTATVANVEKQIKLYTSIHLACHAMQASDNPLDSSFALHKDGCFRLSDILKLKLPNADLAFLSACYTSTGHHGLPDEAVHLAAGMLAAGYRSVISTMWTIQDQHAGVVAIEFYNELLKPERPSAAHALHSAVQHLRRQLGDDSPDALLHWLPYVHFGV